MFPLKLHCGQYTLGLHTLEEMMLDLIAKGNSKWHFCHIEGWAFCISVHLNHIIRFLLPSYSERKVHLCRPKGVTTQMTLFLRIISHQKPITRRPTSNLYDLSSSQLCTTKPQHITMKWCTGSTLINPGLNSAYFTCKYFAWLIV